MVGCVRGTGLGEGKGKGREGGGKGEIDFELGLFKKNFSEARIYS